MADVSIERAESRAPAIANPGPLGLSAFALTTFVLSSVNAGLISAPKGINAAAIVIGLALFYGGLVQLIAGIQEFKTGNTFGATAFCSYGGFWLALGFILLPGSGIVASFVSGGNLDPSFHAALGYFLLGWTIFTGLMFLGTLKSNMALIAVFAFLFLTFLALTVGELGGGASIGQIGGWLGIITALLAWYTAAAGVLASTNSMIKLPTFPRG